MAQERAAKTLPNIMFRPWLKTSSEDRRNGLGGYGRERACKAMEKQAWRAWRNKPGGYGETSLDGMEKQAWRLWRNKPGGHGETGLEAMEK